MLEQEKIIVKMMDELVKYFLSKNGKKIKVEIEDKDNIFQITSSCNIDVSDDDLEFINSKLASHKNMEYDFYWELMGEPFEEDELKLLFLLADNVRIYYENNELLFIIEIKKNKLSKL
ncbi:hypothetical protein [Streptobacillus moniliformis]|uniref:hypothetical protein n=1 Tax=Streptobacillus moniliformis TaxID=34105 RepID=UPI0007E4B21D|nr:hypothetical protein [Streptobacillus moniliformis]